MKTPLSITVLAVLLAISTHAGSITKTWTGAVDQNWHEPGNWSPVGVPAGNDSITIARANVYATAPVTIASGGALTWEGRGSDEAFHGALTIASGGELNLVGSSITFVGVVTNYGAIRGSDPIQFYIQMMDNRPGGLIDFQTAIKYYGVGIRNAGIFRKSAGSGTLFVDVPFTNNAGTVEALSGTINLDRGGSIEGNVHAAAGAVVQLGGGDFTYSTAPAFSGSGAFELLGATLTLLNNPIPDLKTISGTVILNPAFQGGTITNLSLGGDNVSRSRSGIMLKGSYRVTGVLNGLETSADELAIASGATVTWSAGSMKNCAISSGGTVNWIGIHSGSLHGWLTIASGGVLNVGIERGYDLYLSGSLTNAGTLRWTNGFLYFGGGVIVNQPSGLIDAQSEDVFRVNGSGSIVNAGLFRKSAGGGSIVVRIPFTNTTGTVRADMGTLEFQSRFHQFPAGTLAISIGGPTPGADYGHIRFSQPLVLDGAFNASVRNAYLPNPGDTFNVLSYPSFNGDFTCLSGINLGGGIGVFPAVLFQSMTLTAARFASNAPPIFAAPWAGGVRLLRPPGFSDWEFVATTNLFAPIWSAVPVTGCDQATLPVTTSHQYFRLRKNN